ncbi:hypothetical protein V6N13_108373 [Hibiscus sabdariffa]|uniref:Uncharacterized protein n=1 Tax=Hibiscus sabdariffa TaxID=183260 RepID=A0ABR2SS21_9ROSI
MENGREGVRNRSTEGSDQNVTTGRFDLLTVIDKESMVRAATKTLSSVVHNQIAKAGPLNLVSTLKNNVSLSKTVAQPVVSDNEGPVRDAEITLNNSQVSKKMVSEVASKDVVVPVPCDDSEVGTPRTEQRLSRIKNMTCKSMYPQCKKKIDRQKNMDPNKTCTVNVGEWIWQMSELVVNGADNAANLLPTTEPSNAGA